MGSPLTVRVRRPHHTHQASDCSTSEKPNSRSSTGAKTSRGPAIAADHWSFDPAQTVGLSLPGGVPVEELLFFVVVPTCAVLAFEAVRRVRGWPAGDE